MPVDLHLYLSSTSVIFSVCSFLPSTMETKQPSYQRPTRASLGRIVFKPQPVEEKTLSEKQTAWRKLATKYRLDTADRLRLRLAPAQKWPTVNGVNSHRQRVLQSETVAKKANLHIVSPSTIAGASTTEAWSSKFPIPVRTSKDLTTFQQFSLLPVEIRLLIVRNFPSNLIDSPSFSLHMFHLRQRLGSILTQSSGKLRCLSQS